VEIAVLVVARERFELSSAGPEPTMLDRYTTGLQTIRNLGFTNKVTLADPSQPAASQAPSSSLRRILVREG
jgi:hypothetical protein